MYNTLEAALVVALLGQSHLVLAAASSDFVSDITETRSTESPTQHTNRIRRYRPITTNANIPNTHASNFRRVIVGNDGTASQVIVGQEQRRRTGESSAAKPRKNNNRPFHHFSHSVRKATEKSNQSDILRSTARIVGNASGPFALVFFTGAALKRHILGATPTTLPESQLPGSLTDVLTPATPDLRTLEVVTPDSDTGTALRSPRSVVEHFVFPGSKEQHSSSALLPASHVAAESQAGSILKTTSPYVATAMAGALALFSVAGTLWTKHSKSRKSVLTGGYSTWDVENCTFYVDVDRAQKSQLLQGQFIRGSGHLEVDASRGTGYLRYFEQPPFLGNVVSRLIRRKLRRIESFPIPRSRCFANTNEETSCYMLFWKKPELEPTRKRVPAVKAQTASQTKITTFVREIVKPRNLYTSGLLIQLERCPGWRRARYLPELKLEMYDFFKKLLSTGDCLKCPLTEQLPDANDVVEFRGESRTPRQTTVEESAIASILLGDNLQVLACSTEYKYEGELSYFYLLVSAPPNNKVKVHYGVGSTDLLLNISGPEAAANLPCVRAPDRSIHKCIPAFAITPVRNLCSVLDDVADQGKIENIAEITRLKKYTLPFGMKLFAIVVEAGGMKVDLDPKRIAIRKIDSVAYEGK